MCLGHETTSGMLSFALMHLLKNPSTYFKAQAEVDHIIGKRAIQFSDLKDLSYLNAVLRETSRLTPTIPALFKQIPPERAHEVVTLGGYVIKPTDRVMVLLTKAQRDPAVWGEDADEFKPERMLDVEFEKLTAEHPGAWKVSVHHRNWTLC
jgi:cytochrome P450 / NADPH-cytochrome P450 reductase